MLKTLIYCDRCRGPITEGRSLLTATAGPILASQPTVDLCATCLDAFRDFLAGDPFINAEIPPMPEPLGISA